MTDRSDVSGVLDAIDNALGWTDPWADAMTVRYGDNGAGTPGNLAEAPGYHVQPDDGEAVLNIDRVEMDPDGIRWYRDGVQVRFLRLVEAPEMQEGEYSLGFNLDDLQDGVHPWPGLGVAFGTFRPQPRPVPRPFDIDALRAAVARAEYPEQVFSAHLADALQTLRDRMQESLSAAAATTARHMTSFSMVWDEINPKAYRRIFGSAAAPLEPAEQDARAVALDARRNRNTGPARNPHRHRGI